MVVYNGGGWERGWGSDGLQCREWGLTGKMGCWLEEGRLEELECDIGLEE